MLVKAVLEIGEAAAPTLILLVEAKVELGKLVEQELDIGVLGA